ncbi:hypothetical protein [Rickettsia endosymbiont of Rhinocyllus conicus]|uniref:hypothetical protein n=1 Tax=Rickettsia endosymbiont of Rhinocyllus conicus TaxID=3066252 RepID=UPI003132A6F0
MMLTHHGAHGKLKLLHLEDGGFNHQRDYKVFEVLKLVINTVIDLIKYKIAFNSAKKIGQNIKNEQSNIKQSQPALLRSNTPKSLAR